MKTSSRVGVRSRTRSTATPARCSASRARRRWSGSCKASVSSPSAETGFPGFDQAGVEGAADYGELLAELLDPDAYPALSAAMRSGVMRGATGWIDDADFTFGLDLLLDGVEQLIARRSAQGDSG
jgi:hypothetical protein